MAGSSARKAAVKASPRPADEQNTRCDPLRLAPYDFRRDDGIYWGNRGPTFDPVEATLYAASLKHGIETDSLALGRQRRSDAMQVSRICHPSEGTGSIGFPCPDDCLDEDDQPTAGFMAAADAAASTLRALELRDEMLGDRGRKDGVPDRLRSSWQFQVHKIVAMLLRNGMTPAQRRLIMDMDRQYWKNAVASRRHGPHEFDSGYRTETVTSHHKDGNLLWGFRLRGLYAYAGTVGFGTGNLELHDDEMGTCLTFGTDQELPETMINALAGRDVSAAVAIPHLPKRKLGIPIVGITKTGSTGSWHDYRIDLADMVDTVNDPTAPYDTSWMPPHRPGLRGV